MLVLGNIADICLVVLGCFALLLGGFRWHQVLSAGFRLFQAVPRFSKNRTSQCRHRFDVLIFFVKLHIILAFVQKFNYFDSQRLETVERRFLYIYRRLYSHLHRSVWQVLHSTVLKFWTSEMLDEWSPTSKLSDIRLSHIPDDRYIYFLCTRTHLSTIPVFDIFKSFPVFSCDWILVLDNMST